MTTTGTTARPGTQRTPRPRRPSLSQAAYVVALVALVVPRLHSSSALWLDEALSVDIARLPVPDLLAALRHDGSPPVYYVLLHGWMALFGTGDDAVRALSTACSLAALPAAYLVGRRLGGPRAGATSTLVLAATPFAIRYATETRMYALVTLLALLGVLAVLRALERPTLARLATVSLVSGLSALTHYWTLFFLVAGEVLLLVHAGRQGWRVRQPGGLSPAARVALALPAGGVLFLPWLPTFLFQSAHTGTPWRSAPSWIDLPSALVRWGGPGVLGDTLGIALLLLAAWSLRQREGRWLVALGVGGLALGLVVCRVQGAAFALRYSAPMVAPVELAAALALARLRALTRQVATALLTAGALAVAAFSTLLAPRTDAVQVAAAIQAGVQPGDLVVYCPDQLGPAVARLLPDPVDQVVYPTLAGPTLIDWVDYAARNAAASPQEIASEVSSATAGTVWLVRADGYLTYGDQCAQLDADLAALRPGRTVHLTPASGRDGAFVVSFGSTSGS